MDSTDFRIIRYMFPDGRVRLWGSRSIVDPRITAREIGRRVHLSEVAVRNRIRKLHARGEISGDEVWPNPVAFGEAVGRARFAVPYGRRVEGMLDELGSVEGILSARWVNERGRPTIWATIVWGASGSRSGRLRRIRRICGGKPPRSVERLTLPALSRPLTRDEWKVVGAVRSDPARSLTDGATAAGLSPRTFRRHYNYLLDTGAIFWTRRFVPGRLRGMVFRILTAGRAARARVIARIDSERILWVPYAPDALGERPAVQATWVGGAFWVESPPAEAELAHRLRQIDGVRKVVPLVFGRVASYSRWFDAQLSARLADGPADEGVR